MAVSCVTHDPASGSSGCRVANIAHQFTEKQPKTLRYAELPIATSSPDDPLAHYPSTTTIRIRWSLPEIAIASSPPAGRPRRVRFLAFNDLALFFIVT